jgi:hypothetical protein
MNDNVVSVELDTQDEGADGEGKRQRSTIAFPYSDYEGAESLARAIHENVGHGQCAAEQLASWTHQSSKSSSFRSQIAAARLFGLIESADSESYKLSPLGIRAVDQEHARAAKAESFLNVPLFRAVYEKYRQVSLPPPAALERDMAAMGVAEKQKAKARQVLMASAKATGYCELGENKLIAPALKVDPKKDEDDDKKKKRTSGGGDGSGDDTGLNLDPLIMALLRKIPTKEEGWPQDKRLRWFKTFAMNVSQVYDDDQAPVELTISASTSNDQAG